MARRLFATAPRAGNIQVGILLTRKPLELKPLSGFSLDYQLYREARDEAEKRPFSHSFYYKKGALTEDRWLEAQRQNAPHLVQAAEPELWEWDQEREANRHKQAEKQKTCDADYTSLDRLSRDSLYLFIKQNNSWKLPDGALLDSQVLDEAAPQVLQSLVGSKMDTWFVGRVPAGHYDTKDATIFYMKAHIMAGKVVASKNVQEHAWWTKEEAQSKLDPDYYQNVSGMLSP
ncbi:54S ribosomal protein L17 mitochondrial [Kappamyces sp. JEL0829]|nr:54S ribosomal protein L17 mitochondrial [Kappamyces sp. JEL0829]